MRIAIKKVCFLTTRQQENLNLVQNFTMDKSIFGTKYIIELFCIWCKICIFAKLNLVQLLYEKKDLQ